MPLSDAVSGHGSSPEFIPHLLNLDPWMGSGERVRVEVVHGVAGWACRSCWSAQLFHIWFLGLGPARGRVDGSGRDGRWQADTENAVPQGQPRLGPGPVFRQMQDDAALWPGVAGWHVDDGAAQGRAASHGLDGSGEG